MKSGMRLAVLCLSLLGCGPVLLGEEGPLPGVDGNTDGEQDMPDNGGASGGQDAAQLPAVLVRITPRDCGRCFELQAEGSGGQPPYDFEWQDGSQGGQRSVCVDDAQVVLSVVAVDAAAARSLPQTIQLEAGADAGCPDAAVAIDAAVDAGPAPRLCLQNGSFEGTPAPIFEQPAFDADHWSVCTNPMRTNTPGIGNDSVSVTGSVPPPTDGLTYVGLAEGQQVSQELCSDVPQGVPLHLALDLSRINLGDGAEQAFLQIWGGLAVNCSQHELLWASPALEVGWQHFCVTLQADSFMTQLTLRADSDMTLPSPAYLLIDNLQPVDSCP